MYQRFLKIVIDSKPTAPGKSYENLILIGLVLIILPFLILAFFTHPQNDDYILTMTSRLFGFWGSVLHWYNNWTARYFSCAIQSASPLLFDSFFGYKLATLGYLLVMIGSFYYFISKVVVRRITIKQKLIGAMTIFAVFISQMPAVAEGLYWMASQTTNLLGIPLMLFLFGILISSERTPREQNRYPSLILATLLVIAISGTHELPMLYTLALLILLNGYRLFYLKEVSKPWLLLLATSLLCVVVVILAPGTYYRFTGHQATPESGSPIGTLSRAAVELLLHLGEWIFLSPLLFVAILTFLFLTRVGAGRTTLTVNPLLSTAIFFILLYGAFLSVLGGSITIEKRTLDGIYLFFVVGFFINIFLAAAYFNKVGRPPPPLKLSFRAAIIGAALLFMLWPGANIRTAWDDLLSGRAYRYDQELTARYEAIEKCPSVCEVSPLQNRPTTIFYFENAIDVINDSQFYVNYKTDGYSAYFQKAKIYLGNRYRLLEPAK